MQDYSRQKKLVSAQAESLRRIAKERKEVAEKMNSDKVARHVQRVVKPNSPKTTLRKTGIALIAAPDPVTGVAGVAMVASSFAVAKDDPLSLADIAKETAKLLRELDSFSV